MLDLNNKEVFHITLKEFREYFHEFTCERLSSDLNNKKLIEDFQSPEMGKELERYLKENAWGDDISGETSVYIVKDHYGNFVMYFSLRCGLLYAEDKFNKLSQEEKDYVLSFKSTIGTDNLNGIYADCISKLGFDKTDMLFQMAQNQLEQKKSDKELNEAHVALNVDESYSAIEIRHLCKNIHYVCDIPTEVPIGIPVFWEIIVEKILSINKIVGCKYLYLFAADNTKEPNTKKLVSHYKSSMGFSDIKDVKVVKERYDRGCLSLSQEIIELIKNREEIWNKYSDLFD